ncbi:CDP-glucose 4,6-dehydratase [bacterium HR36]|nr:CDP-glucose 4,6-dehydratase [bacterium HR36]
MDEKLTNSQNAIKNSSYAWHGLQPRAEYWRGRLVVVTGATGFLGWHLVQWLRHLGARVRTFALHPPLDHPLLTLKDIEPIFGDVRNQRLLQDILSESSVIFHAAGPVAVWGIDADTIMQSHVVGTKHVLQAAPPQAKIVYTSSVTTIGATRKPIPLDEEHSFNLGRLALPYIQAKRVAEQTVLKACQEGRWACVVNPGYLLGPEDYGPSVLGRFCHRFWKGRIWLVPRGGINVADVRDVARGHLLAAERGQPGSRYILGGHNLSFRELCHLLAHVSATHPRFLCTCPSPLLAFLALLAQVRAWWKKREPYPSVAQVKIGSYYWYYSSRRAMEELGYSVRDIAITVRDTWEWYSRTYHPKWRAFQRWWLRPAA